MTDIDLDELEQLARALEDDYSPTDEHWRAVQQHNAAHGFVSACSPRVILALIASAREAERLRASFVAGDTELERRLGAERERGNLLCDRIAELEREREFAIGLQQQMDRDAYAKGRAEERAAVVAWVSGAHLDDTREDIAEVIERGDHVKTDK